jgi:GntR family transcriptional regulator
LDRKWVSTSAPYVGPHNGDAWSQEAAAQGSCGTQRIVFAGPATPPDSVGRQLGIPDGGTAIVRRRVMYLDERPVELTDSYYALTLAEGTPLASSRKIPGGAPRLLADLGHGANEVHEDVTARPATRKEAESLQLDSGEWVLVLERLTLSAAGVPVEVSVMTMPARQRRLHYTMKVG